MCFSSPQGLSIEDPAHANASASMQSNKNFHISYLASGRRVLYRDTLREREANLADVPYRWHGRNG
jgi:hypothetical protein